MTVAAQVMAYDPNAVKPGWIAFFLVLILLIATGLLVRSMNRHLGKIQAPYREELGGPPPRRRFISDFPAGPVSAEPAASDDPESDSSEH